MRGPWIIFFMLLQGAATPLTTYAQHTFDDLPVNDPSHHSVLGPHEDPAKKIRNNLFVVASFDKSICFPGQQIMLTYRLYTALQSTSAIIAKPLLNGFTAKEQKVDETPLPDKTIDGRSYHGFTIWKVLLTPLQTGSYTIDPLAVNNDVRYTAADGKPASYSGTVTSNKPTINVLPLPPGGQPPAFSGLIGKWQIHSRLVSRSLDAGESDTLLIETTGT